MSGNAQDPLGCGQIQPVSFCPVIAGIPPLESGCLGFVSSGKKAACKVWCDKNPEDCDAVKMAACNPGSKNAFPFTKAWVRPECGCIAGAASDVAFPAALNLTYSEFQALLIQTLPSLAASLTNPVCWWPGCTASDTLKTSVQIAQQEASHNESVCPVAIQNCINIANDFNIKGNDNIIEFKNQCQQQISGDAPGGASPSPSSPAGPTPAGPTPAGPSPSQPKTSGLSQGAKIGLAVGGVILLVLIIIIAAVASRKKANASPAPVLPLSSPSTLLKSGK